MKPGVAKRAGGDHENWVCQHINERHGTEYERRRLMGSKDCGDLTTPFVTECKKAGALSIPEWLRELEAEIVNAQAPTGFIAARIKGRSEADVTAYYAILPMERMLDLLAEAGHLPPRVDREPAS